LLAWGIILAFGRNALKVVGIVLEAAIMDERSVDVESALYLPIPGLVRVGETS